MRGITHARECRGSNGDLLAIAEDRCGGRDVEDAT